MSEPFLQALFDPRRIILIGASDRALFSAGIARYLLTHGFADKLTMVNAKGKRVFDRPTFATVAEASAEGPFDLAIIAIPAAEVPAAVDSLADIGCRLAIVESAGFAEAGPEGAALQHRLLETARKHGVRLLGPNCIGVIDTHTGFAATEVQDECMKPGAVALVAQSGVFGSILLDWAPSDNLRLSKAITMGNRVDLNEADFLRYLADDEHTRAVAMYLEGVADGRAFFDAVASCSRRKPVIVLKGGRTAAGARAIRSHTASLAGADLVFDGALRQAGGIRADSLEHLIDLARAFAACPTPPGDRVAMITTSGSQGILATDAITEAGLPLAELSPWTIERIKKIAPDWMTIGNPLDVGPSGLFAEGIQALLADDNVDALLIHIAIPWGAMSQMLQAGMPMESLVGDLDTLREAAARKPVLVSHVGFSEFRRLVQEAFGDFLTIYPTAERAAAVLAALINFRKEA